MPYQLSMEDAMRVCRDAGYSFLDANFCGMSRLGKKEAPMTLTTGTSGSAPGRSWPTEPASTSVRPTLFLGEAGFHYCRRPARWGNSARK